MTGGQRLRYTGLLALSALLGVYELFFLPLRLDGTVLPNLGGVPFPVSVVVAGLTMPWLVTRASKIKMRPAVAGGPLFAWLATLFLFIVFVPGGDLIVIADWRTLLLLVAGAFPATIKIGDVLAKAALLRAAGER
ncbi:hypothetical protein ACOBQX_20845 [Actinokineospora sp. G85]|uniref:hypothetical protein n=1 Tax=Actinokineospora sp. G85 TaxID=3406626 RepID=UPI003C78B485